MKWTASSTSGYRLDMRCLFSDCGTKYEIGAFTGALRRLFELFNKRGNDFEEIADDAVIGNFEDGRVWVFINGGNRARSFHPHDMLNRAAYSQRKVELRRNGLS